MDSNTPTSLPIRPALSTLNPNDSAQSTPTQPHHPYQTSPAEFNDAPSLPDEQPSAMTYSSTKEAISRLMNGKDKEWKAVTEKRGPLNLLDLPVDILKEIVKEVTHTNDLTSLALSHSALHRLATPHIYSRFDIVWPESTQGTEPRTGVDALTYGLATLVMAEDVFGEPDHSAGQSSACNHCGHVNRQPQPTALMPPPSFNEAGRRRRRGNYYAQFTRKFSLGNGPPDWVADYMITKEGGKMLGTLVALAIARMRNLETFVWDMPTGVIRDVWNALASLGERRTFGPECRLEKVWIRWHKNHLLEGNQRPPLVSNLPPDAILHSPDYPVPPGTLDRNTYATPYSNQVEAPTFSILPPLKSLTVLEIDELAYLDEMSVLIGRSKHRLRELRVGIARHAKGFEWTAPWDGPGIHQNYRQADRDASNTSVKRLGGVLGVLVGHVYNIKKRRKSASACPEEDASTREEDQQTPTAISTGLAGQIGNVIQIPLRPSNITIKSTTPKFIEDLPPPDSVQQLPIPDAAPHPRSEASQATPTPKHFSKSHRASNDDQDHLKLETLELERVQLSNVVLGGALDWTVLTNLTILDCPYHQQLWKMLDKKFTPSKSQASLSDYALKLRKVHVNAVSPELIKFLKETLAPDSLQVMFLQKSKCYNSKVSINRIYQGPIKRHRKSLRKMCIDSGDRNVDDNLIDQEGSGWKQWMLSREIMRFITSGQMPSLRELGFAVDHKDWHYFLRSLPAIPHIRSLAIPFVDAHGDTAKTDAKELALQIVDIVTLCPEIELCYLGISTKCFEIIETKYGDSEARLADFDTAASSTDGGGLASGDEDTPEDSAEDDDDEDMDDDQEDDDDDVVDDEDDEDDADDLESDLASEDGRPQSKFRLREILFYDDKVAIFRARLGRIS